MEISNQMFKEMLEEFDKRGKFFDFVTACMATYGTTLQFELHKAITWEYYQSVIWGCNKDK